MIRTTSRNIVVGMAALAAVFVASMAYSHCQVPCGIYDDHARFNEIGEHITTIEKSMKMLDVLNADEKPNMNQVVRWVNNKDHHADKLSEIVTYYFMAQRIKLPAAGDAKAKAEYVKNLSLLHELLVYSMKAKHTTDAQYVEKLRATLDKFHNAYGHAH